MTHPLLQYRLDHDLTQEALARVLEVSAMAVSRWERGDTPKRTMRQRIAQRLGIDPTVFIELEKQPVPARTIQRRRTRSEARAA